MIVAFALFGRVILNYTQVQIAALEGAGGLLLLLAGPGAIVATMLYVQRVHSPLSPLPPRPDRPRPTPTAIGKRVGRPAD